jgi:hypothetical protein
MNRLLRTALLSSALTITGLYSQAQDTGDSTRAVRKKFYTSGSFDMFIFSTSVMDKLSNPSTQLSTLRFTYFPNLGLNFNYDFNNTIGLFSGINMKNIGFIEKIAVIDSTVKRRVLTLGVPLGIKVGKFSRHNFGFLGGGVDFPFNYKEKGYIRRGNKDKFNEWFSDRTAPVMPYFFAGFSYGPGITVKFQYYPQNFLNTSYAEWIPSTQGAGKYEYIYSNYTNVNLILLSIGFDVPYSSRKKIIKAGNSAEKQTM